MLPFGRRQMEAFVDGCSNDLISSPISTIQLLVDESEEAVNR